MTLIEEINQHPLAGAMILVALLIVHQITKHLKGKSNESKSRSETSRLTEQSNEAVNVCARKSLVFMEKFDKYLHENDLRSVPADLTKTIQLLEKVVENQSVHNGTLARTNNLCDSIISNLEDADSRIVYEKMQAQAESIKSIVKDIKRTVNHISEKE